MTEAAFVLDRAIINREVPVPLRALIIGGPRTGKTTLAGQLADEFSVPVRHTDDLMHLPWGEDSKAATAWLDEPGEWIIEGYGAVRALRKWMANNLGKRLDGLLVIYIRQAPVPLEPKHFSGVKSVHTIWTQIEDEVRLRGARVSEIP